MDRLGVGEDVTETESDADLPVDPPPLNMAVFTMVAGPLVVIWTVRVMGE
jgi:hypothetical protein